MDTPAFRRAALIEARLRSSQAPAQCAFNARTSRPRQIRSGLLYTLAVAALTFATSARADVDVTNVQLAGPGGYYTVDVNGEDVYDAGLVLTIGSSQVFANCDDLYHNIDLGQTATFTAGPFSAGSNPSNFDGGSYSSAQVGALSWLLDTSATIWKAGPGSNPSEQLDLAALQLASWMVGNPQAVFANYDPDVYAAAQSYITQSVGKSAFPGDTVEQLSSSAGVQGQIIDTGITPVPEPATWALMLTGLGAVGQAMRKRTRIQVAYG